MHPPRDPPSTERDLGRIADEYCERRRQGEPTSVDDFAKRYPEHENDLRRFLPTLDLLERAAADDVEIAPEAARPGKVIGDFRIVRELGRGGMGVVFEAVQKSIQRRVALKLLPVQATLDSQFLERFKREAKAAGKLQHPNIVPVYGSGEADGIHYLAMQFVDGFGLERVSKYVRAQWEPDPDEPPLVPRRVELAGILEGLRSGKFAPAPKHARAARGAAFTSTERQRYFREVARLGLQVADALAFAHANGILHRDIKPSNLLLDAQGNVWVADFGLCKPRESDDLTLSGDVLGTLRYMAPERFLGLSDVRSDVYGLGVTLYELLVLRDAFEDSNPARLAAAVVRGALPRPSSLQPGIPVDLETIVCKATRLETHERYPTANALAEDLRAFLEDRPISAHPPGLPYYLKLAIRRNWGIATTVAAALVVLLATTILYVVNVNRARSRAEEAQAQEAAQRTEAQFQSAVANLAAADGALRAGDVALARKRLAAVPAELRNWEWHHLDAGLDRSSRTIAPERPAVSEAAWDQGIRAASYSPDASWIAAGPERELILYEAESGAVVATVRAHDSPLTSLAWVGADAVATTGSWAREVVLWSVPELEELARLAHEENIRAVGADPAGTWIATGSITGEVHLWDAATRERAAILEGHTGEITRLAFAPMDERLDARLASASKDGTVRIWDVSTQLVVTVFRGHADIVTGVAWDPEGRRLASTSMDGTLFVWEPGSGSPRRLSPGQPESLRDVSWSPDGARLVTASEDRSIRFRDAKTGHLLDTYLGHEAAALSVEFHPDGQRTLSSSNDHTIKEWSLGTPPVALTLRGHVADVNTLAFTPDGATLFTAGRDTSLRIWDVETGEQVAALFGSTRPTGRIDASADGTILASGTFLGEVVLWDVDARREEIRIPLHAGRVTGVSFHPERPWIASSGVDGTIAIYDFSEARELRRLEVGSSEVTSVRFSPGGERLACGTWDGTVQVWNALTGAKELDLVAHGDTVAAVGFAPDGRQLATASYDRTGAVWEVESGRELFELVGHSHALTSITFSPDGTRIATSARSGAVKLWDAASGLEVATLRGHDDWVTGVAFGPNGRRLASTSSDGTAKIWDSVSPVGRTRRGGESRAGDPEELYASAWEIVCAVGREREDYALARRRAWCLYWRHDTRDGRFATVLGGGELRLGNPSAALEDLGLAERLMAQAPASSRAAWYAFSTLAHAARADAASAEETLAELEAFVAEHALAGEDVLGLLAEARRSVRGAED